MSKVYKELNKADNPTDEQRRQAVSIDAEMENLFNRIIPGRKEAKERLNAQADKLLGKEKKTPVAPKVSEKSEYADVYSKVNKAIAEHCGLAKARSKSTATHRVDWDHPEVQAMDGESRRMLGAAEVQGDGVEVVGDHPHRPGWVNVRLGDGTAEAPKSALKPKERHIPAVHEKAEDDAEPCGACGAKNDLHDVSDTLFGDTAYEKLCTGCLGKESRRAWDHEEPHFVSEALERAEEKPVAVDHFVEWLKHGNRALRAFPSSPRQKKLQAQAEMHRIEAEKNPTEFKRRLAAIGGKPKQEEPQEAPVKSGKAEPDQPGGLGEMKMGEGERRTTPQPGTIAMAEGDPSEPGPTPPPGHESYHEYNKQYLDSDATDTADPEFAPHAGEDSEFGYKRKTPVRFTPEQDAELLGHLHAIGHHTSRAYTDADQAATPDDVARNRRLNMHHYSTAGKHFDEYRRKFKEYSGQPVSGYSPGSWDMLEEGHEGGRPGEPHPHDSTLKISKSFAKHIPESGHLDAAAHHLLHRDRNAEHGTTWSEPAAKLHDALYREHAQAAGEDPDNPSAMLRSKAEMVEFKGGPRYPGHVVFHRWDDESGQD